jgi:5-methylcytosine-specific restriction endonuclease McrA
MTAISNGVHNVMSPLTPGGDPGLAELSDEELLANTRRLVGKSNQLLAALLVHLAEVEVRGAHRSRRCASLYTYCIYELRFSEDAAARRSAAARLVKQFPLLFAAIADGELHLTGLLMIGPHLTPENHVEVLGRAKFRTKKELGKLLRELCPLPQVPDRIEPIGPQLRRTLRNPTWEEYVSARAPRVRELPVGERPRDWANDSESIAEALPAEPPLNEPLPVGPVPRDLAPVTGPQQYQLQFRTTEEHAQLVERAKALLARSRPGMSLGELHLEAMRLLVASLEKRRFGAAEPHARRQRRSEPTGQAARQGGESDSAPRQRGESDGAESEHDDAQLSIRPRSRYIPAAVRREVFQRDGGCCSYVDARGERCCETHYLEIHHSQPFAKDGAHLASNLTLRCAAHNALAAEEDFGKAPIAERRDATRHEALRRQCP